MKKNKVLFVIPAYNEAGNIEKVLKEINNDVSFADLFKTKKTSFLIAGKVNESLLPCKGAGRLSH